MQNSDGRLQYYFDTSAINKLHDDPAWDDGAFDALLMVADVRFSALNIAEIASTSDPEHRVSLMRVVNKLSRDFRPLALPSEILRRTLEFFATVRRAEADGRDLPDAPVNLSVEGDEAPFWLLVKDPELVRDERTHREMVEFKDDQERKFRGLHEEIRPRFQDVRSRLDDPYRTGAGLIKYLRGPFEDSDFETAFQEFFTDIARDFGSSFAGDGHDVFNRLEAWSFFFGAMVHTMYNRAISTGRFGWKSNPGAVDTKQAIYLIAGNRFVTADVGSRQFRALRVVNKLGMKPRRVLKYNEFGPMILRA